MARNRNQRKPEPATTAGQVYVDERIPAEVPVPEPPPPARCDNCPYWNRKPDDKTLGPLGECRRRPPYLIDPSLLTLSGAVVRFGLTRADTSCGEHPRFRSPAS